MRLVFAGTPAPAVPSLRALHASSHDIVTVVTRDDAPLGRKRVLTPSPVAAAAAELGLPVVKTRRLDDAATTAIERTHPDLGVIVAYGGLVREPLLSAPRHGWINLHFSQLPRWRGAAPVQHGLIAGDADVAASVFRLVAELDAGDVFDEVVLPAPQDATAGEVLDLLAERGAALLRTVVDAIADGSATARPQEGVPTFAPKLGDADGRLDWNGTREEVIHRFRGVTPEPGAHTILDGARLKVLRAREAAPDAPRLSPGRLAIHGRAVIVGTATEPVLLERVQPAGRGPMIAEDWFRGLRHSEPVLGS
ncbi:methionyl-tRNA formyltransferase [Microbacterium sp. ET2]|uniref:methionyl-tRNA formyltransferase n=1 Tax=Microbacterium albipurpureum TaxID=3050384 RepID=UPI00259CE880|nr:methionyl-tRNA formyltransferase [Microbacterium sp. ET2 (Ac-2212)]WJL95594.1 methionyl-tRNA formyltransferase [Microbacterium sp. ET2 (Ac-2212)]